MKISRKKNCRIAICDLRSLAVLTAVALCVGGCATKPKTWSAPDSKRVDAASRRLSDAEKKVSETADRAEARIVAAQKNTDKLAAHSASVIRLVKELGLLVPPELKPKADALEAAVDAQQSEEGDLVTNLSGARSEMELLRKKDLPEVRNAKQESDDAVAEYKGKAALIAADATAERAARIAAERQLSREKWMRLLWKIGGGFLVLGLIALVVLFALGKISWSGIKLYLGIR